MNSKDESLLDNHYMEKALELAKKARGRTSPNPMVGAIVVKDGEIVGVGYHKKAGTPHAEVHALTEAGEKAKGATIYVTLEPCSHYGRTPPCSEAIIKAGIKRVKIAMVDPNPLVAGRGVKQLEAAGIEVETGFLEERAKKLNESFIKYITTKTPFVLLKTAMTLDGKIATHTKDSKWVTGKEARGYVHKIRDSYDGILVGIGTLLADNPSLTTRLEEFNNNPQTKEKGKNPVRIIVDSQGKIPLDSKVVETAREVNTIVAVTNKADESKLKVLEALGVTVLKCGLTNNDKVDLKDLMIRLGEREITSLLVEGGSEIAASFLEAGLVDKVLWFIAPKIIGGNEAPGPIGGKGLAEMSEALKLKDIKIKTFGEDISIEGYL